MKKLRCQFFGVFSDTTEYIRKNLRGFRVQIYEHELQSPDELDPKTEVLGVFVGSKVDLEIMNKLPHLKLIVTMSTGYDHIDIEAARKRKVAVCNVPTYGENTVAEHTMALILSLSRKLYPSIKRVKEGIFNYDGLEGFDLKGKTVGVIGTGHIGMHVIHMLQGFDMNVLAFDAYPNKELAAEHGFCYTSLPNLLSKSDIITLHVPLFKKTYHLLNKKTLKKIKRGAYIINTARGGLIEAEALLKNIESGRLAGAGLDVLELEDTMQHPDHIVLRKQSPKELKVNLMQNRLINHPQVIVTPHNAFNSREALERILEVTIGNIKAFANENIQNDVTAIKKK